MKAKPIVAGALKPNKIKNDEANEDIQAIGSLIPPVKMHGKSVVTFGGTNEYFTGPNIVNVGTADYTISSWVYLPNGSAAITPISKWVDTNNYFIFYVQQNNGVCVCQWKVDGTVRDNYTVITSSLVADAWNHITITNDRSAGDGGMKMYINGASPSLTFNVSDTATTHDCSFDASTSVGRYRSTGNYLYNPAGVKQADLRIYDKSLSATEVATMHSESLIKGPNAARLKGNLMHYFSFGDTAKDGRCSGGTGFFEFFDLPSLAKSYAPVRESGQICVNPNADLSFGTGWTLNSSPLGAWAIFSGKFKGQANLNQMINSATVTIGGLYQVIYNGTYSGSSSILVYVGGTGSGIVDNSDGKHTHYIEANKDTGVTFISAVGTGENVTVDDITLYRFDRGGLMARNMEREDFTKETVATNVF